MTSDSPQNGSDSVDRQAGRTGRTGRPGRTGRKRRDRTTRPGVKVLDALARWTITVGGIGTIAAVCLVAVFLAWVVAPLFLGGDLSEAHAGELVAEVERQDVLAIGFDEYRTVTWAALADGRILFQDLASGEAIADFEPFEGARPTASAFPPGEEQAAFGFEDGTLRLVRIGFSTSFLDEEPAGYEDLTTGQRRTTDGGVIERTPAGPLRLLEPRVSVEPALDWSPGSPILHLDVSTGPTGPLSTPMPASTSTEVPSRRAWALRSVCPADQSEAQRSSTGRTRSSRRAHTSATATPRGQAAHSPWPTSASPATTIAARCTRSARSVRASRASPRALSASARSTRRWWSPTPRASRLPSKG